MKHLRRACMLSILIALVALAAGGARHGVSAHAELVAAQPSAGAAEATAPNRIELRFSETIEPSLSSIVLLSSDGSPVDLAPIALDPNDQTVMSSVVVAPDTMQSGVYTVVWGAYSAEDGHASSGSFTFSVGTGEAPAQLGARSTGVSAWSVVGKWLELLGLVVLTGLAFFAITSGTHPRKRTAELERIVAVLAAIALAGMVISFRARVVVVSGEGMTGGFQPGITSDLLRSTYGHAWIVRACALIVVLALALLAGRPASNRALAIVTGCGIAGLATIAISGHAAAVDPAWLATLVDLLHMSAAALWLGGLAGLLLVVSAAGDTPEDRRLLRTQGNRFAAAVAVIVLAGLAATYWHVGGRRSLQSTDYGRTLLVKIAIVVLLLGLAYYNRRILQGERGKGRWVPVAVGAELVLAMVILLFSADLGQTPPATQPLVVPVAARAIELAEEATTETTTVRLTGVVTGDPTDEIAISISPVTDLQRVIVHSALRIGEGDATIGDRFDAAPVDGQPGSYRFPAGKLGIAGPWQLDITVRRAGVEDERVTLPVDTSGLASFGVRAVEDRWGGFRLTSHTALALVLAAVMLVIGVGGLRRITGLEPLASGFLLATSILITGGFLVSAARGLVPVTPDHAIVNPVDTSAGALVYAGDLYRLNCAICHGVDGRGAGTSNLAHLHGNDADLTSGRTESQSDGDVRYWIENGVAGTRMPAFGAALTEEEHWELVVLIRQLQQNAREAEAAE